MIEHVQSQDKRNSRKGASLTVVRLAWPTQPELRALRGRRVRSQRGRGCSRSCSEKGVACGCWWRLQMLAGQRESAATLRRRRAALAPALAA
eukprot:1737052-Pleurochrysis_carterae.AAC.3